MAKRKDYSTANANEGLVGLYECLDSEFANFEEKFAEFIQNEAKELKADVQMYSPRDTGEYAKGWKLRKAKKSDHYFSFILYNKDKPKLVHLLEFGHIARDGSRVPPSQHVLDITDKHKQQLDKFVEGYFK